MSETHPPDNASPEASEAPPAVAEAVSSPEPRPSRGQTLWREWVRPLGIVLTLMVCLRSAFADWNDVPTGSMKPTIVEGDRIFVNKAAYDLRVPLTRIRLATWGNPKRGDIVVLFSPDDGKRLVKRVVGEPGDTVEVRHNKLLINDRAIEYEPLTEAVASALDPSERLGYSFEGEKIGDHPHPVMLALFDAGYGFYGPAVVPDGQYFVMGDNRSHSRDSRVFGFVARPAIVGQATAVVLSLDHDNHFKPRWDRFFRALD
jgi:signal peptidase I